MTRAREIAKLLRSHAVLESLDADLLLELEDIATIESVPPGIVLLKEGMPADCLFLLLEGTVAVGFQGHGGRFTPIEYVSGNEVLGWSWLIEPYIWEFDGIAHTSVRAINLDARELRSRMAENGRLCAVLSRTMLGVMASRVRAIRLGYMNACSGGL
ncbi:cyclic nucleotide-binding domain-containing protein [Phaeovibrio sulfidiphilus]|uniref:Cyclic nucleotide-binding domain-containing protein n=1 Tax=Phaeovibrio sulfidiphilus TaxID=1220600 RepID=A0A8J6YKH8_9PROT|nr:cyclic nucleotide-binding domain-containing protein [Phaeovibrio sulfidiphilus]MBE1236235.1 cyclic nucleotide-binding domain-containing protein [Phaeovibrio sulfidiphilus]